MSVLWLAGFMARHPAYGLCHGQSQAGCQLPAVLGHRRGKAFAGGTELCWVICPLLEPRACCEPEPQPRQALAERGCDVAVVPPVKRFPPRLERAESPQ